MKITNKLKLFLTIIILSIIAFSGCINPIDNPDVPTRGFYMGVLPIPADNQDFRDVYLQVSQYSEFVPIWATGTGAEGFWDYANQLKGSWGKIFLDNYIRANDMFPIIHFSFIDKNQENELILKKPEHISSATLQNEEWRSLYKNSIIDVVRTTKPLYLSTGNEVNKWYEEFGATNGDPNGFQHFVTLHEEIYEEIKNISPETIIFCIFSREIVGENREVDLEVLNLFNPNTLDILVFTSYPNSLPFINSPSDIPIDYYSKIFNYMPQKPFGFSELGWPTLTEFGGEQGQADFLLKTSKNLTIDQGIDLHLFGYCWLHDIDENDTTGLIKRNGEEKLGYLTWEQISQS